MKKINIVLFGTGNVGSKLVNQILQARETLSAKGKPGAQSAGHCKFYYRFFPKGKSAAFMGDRL